MVKKLPVVPTGKAGSAAEAPAHVNWREVYPVISDGCTLCLECTLFCPEGALVHEDDKDKITVRLDLCKGCGICANVCQPKAISMAPEFTGPKGIFPVKGDK